MPLVKRDETKDVLDETLQNQAQIVELDSDDDEFEDEETTAESNGTPSAGRATHIPKPFPDELELPPWLQLATLGLFHEDLLVTTTTEAQDKVTAECLPLLLGEDNLGMEVNSHGLPHLRRTQHYKFLQATFDPLPAPYAAMDASRPWLFYWALAGLSTLGEDVSHYRDRLVETVRPLQNLTGGFGGGHGQLSHCACSYATILALTAVGGLDMVDRKAMWHWLGSVKQADGGFCMAIGAEEDIRGAYCAMTIITILNLPLELPADAPGRNAGLTSFVDRLGEWVGRCQTYEGGIGGAPTNEAHGAYAFCALACLSILDAPHISIPAFLDVSRLTSWLSARQTSPEGGFQGRQEKLVDACYSHWVGGCWSLIQTAQIPTIETRTETKDIWNRSALVRYLLTCAQQPGKKGGMRDKPSTRPDAYHTAYSLAGLSHALNRYTYDGKVSLKDQAGESGRLMAAFNWRARRPTEQEMVECKVDGIDVVEFVHPVFVLPMGAVETARERFAKGGF